MRSRSQALPGNEKEARFSMQLSGSVFIVTGGSSGLGEATARRFVAAGGRVVLADVSQRGESVAQELGSSATFERADVTDEASVASAVETAVSRFGVLNGAVNCAGIVLGKRVVGKDGPHELPDFARVI